MLEAFGIAFVALTVAAVTFLAALRFMDNRRWWREAGLAAVIPMLAWATIAALIATTLAVWLIT